MQLFHSSHSNYFIIIQPPLLVGHMKTGKLRKKHKCPSNFLLTTKGLNKRAVGLGEVWLSHFLAVQHLSGFLQTSEFSWRPIDQADWTTEVLIGHT